MAPSVFSYSSSSLNAMAIVLTFLTLILCSSSRVAVSITPTANAAPKNRTVPAILAFGDSIVDAGNNNKLPTVVRCNFLPYGRDFMGGPTGRFSNGFVPSDLIAQLFGVKQTVPAYLDPALRAQDLPTGVTFASGGAGFDPLTSRKSLLLTMTDQLNLFKKYTRQLKKVVGEERAASIISQSLYVVCSGSNDIANTYYPLPLGRDINVYTDKMVRYASTFLQQLYGLGARKIAVFSIPPIGCAPSQRTLAGGIRRRCAEDRNRAALLFNSKLEPQVVALSRQLPQGSRIKYLDTYKPLLDIIQNPVKYGLQDVDRGCCGTGLIEGAVTCNQLTPFTCKNVTKYVFFDSFHPTEDVYKIITNEIYKVHKADFL